MTIIEYLTANPCSQFGAIMKATGMKRSACSNLLAELKKNGAIIMTGAKRTSRYTVAPVESRIHVDGDRIALVTVPADLDGAA